ncbi:hypothetical protein [Kordiimonas marina]|uniref:hypothetical protein n=1 Tax=Kordiimonas marina TaxID=2872312 RepID=UPI001FF1348B|nr:hypothetical protein [Kordiimonas marina]MCJ9429652.1 hypothetical protein [Kordiimonas marina]
MTYKDLFKNKESKKAPSSSSKPDTDDKQTDKIPGVPKVPAQETSARSMLSLQFEESRM